MSGIGGTRELSERSGSSEWRRLRLWLPCDRMLSSIARPMALGVPPAKTCERAARKDPLVCEIKEKDKGGAGGGMPGGMGGMGGGGMGGMGF